MCGVCGIIAREPLTAHDDARVARLNGALAHRGPDGEGSHRSTQVHLAMRRLAIIDVAGGQQPLFNEDRSIALVFNGEVYNYRELQTELRARGHQLQTGSDAEVLVHLYEERGADAVLALRGMFAFALHDARRQRVLLGRDRLGEKPLYLREEDGRVVFASELRALFAGGEIPFALDPAAVDRYLHLLYAPEPAGIVQGVRQLDAGMTLEIDLTTWAQRERRYWSLLDAPALEGDAVHAVRAQLEEIGTLVIRSERPVGVALSGGLDSSTVAALAVRAHGPGLQAFTVGYRGRPDHDERAQASALAQTLGIPIHEIELDVDSMVEDFPATVRERDEPIADLAGYGHRAVMRLARDHGVPVLLTGYGGDELFFGYDWMRRAVAETEAKRRLGALGFPPPAYGGARVPGAFSRAALAAWWRDDFGRTSAAARRALHMSGPLERPVFYELSDEYQGAAFGAPSVVGEAVRAVHGNVASLWDAPQSTRADLAILERMVNTYCRSIGLAQGDRYAMAVGVEARIPLLDYRLAETVVGLRKSRPGPIEGPKQWLREAMRGVLPDEVLDRPKRGFTPPIYAWHRALMERWGHTLRDGVLVRHGVLSRDGAARLAAMSVPEPGFSWLPFAALVLETWCREMEALR
jgi:asparagine synthase (glutamine-hydrolysing)